ncbi:glycosyl transferase [Shewanella hanedai]|uniref:Glycosyltransferase family 4 protein n=1 Tax=Shewanella hanedai TaxID=25 RepID=A0A553JMJ1_SHEHA|nr:glycosyltransferase family 4 protein [Shewanella hanedai]TRY13685.1 glycosyltransferase family 4 protein [Shewanella hanedai]GGI98636.1 glycosyl transferase [Shewanella hanedai]
MNILLVNDFEKNGGAETVFNEQFKLLKSKNINVYKYVYQSSKINALSYIFNIKALIGLLRFVRKNEINVVWIHNFYHLLSPSILAIKYFSDVKIIYTAHDFHLVCANPSFQFFEQKNGYNFKRFTFKDLLTKRLDRRGAVYSTLRKVQWFLNYKLLKLHRNIDVVTAPSTFLLGKIETVHKNVKLLRNPLIKPLEASFKVEYDDRLSLLYIGRLSDDKGVLEFLDQVENSKYIKDIIIVGDGPQYEILKSRFKNNFIIKFVGRIENTEISNYILQSDLLFLSSLWYENAPMTILEAAQYKKQILLNDIGSLSCFGRQVGNACYFNMEVRNVDEVLSQLVNRKFVVNLNNREFCYDKYFNDINSILNCVG